jgi:hypothetical protein
LGGNGQLARDLEVVGQHILADDAAQVRPRVLEVLDRLADLVVGAHRLDAQLEQLAKRYLAVLVAQLVDVELLVETRLVVAGKGEQELVELHGDEGGLDIEEQRPAGRLPRRLRSVERRLRRLGGSGDLAADGHGEVDAKLVGRGANELRGPPAVGGEQDRRIGQHRGLHHRALRRPHVVARGAEIGVVLRRQRNRIGEADGAHEVSQRRIGEEDRAEGEPGCLGDGQRAAPTCSSFGTDDRLQDIFSRYLNESKKSGFSPRFLNASMEALVSASW